MTDASQPPSKSLPRLAAPLMVSFTLRFLFTTVDLVYAAVMQDKVAVAAISLFFPIQSIFVATWSGLSAGFTASLAAAFGARDEARVRCLKRGMIRILIGQVPLLLLFAAGLHFLVPHLGLKADLAAAFHLYAMVLVVGMPFTGFWSIYPDSIVKAHHDTTHTMLAGFASTIANVALNTWFVFGCGWGLFGIALATVLSRFAGLAWAACRVRILERRRRTPAWDAGPRSYQRPAVRSILTLAIPGALTHLLTACEDTVVARLLTRLPDATDAVAAFGVYSRSLQIALMPAVATSVAVLPFVARRLHEGQVADIRRNLVRGVVLALGLALAFTLPMATVLAEPAARFFLDAEPGTATPPQALWALRLLPVAAVALVPFLVLRPSFEAIGRPRLGIAVAVLRFAALSLPLVLGGALLAPAAGLPGFVGLVAGLIAAGAITSGIVARLVARLLA